MNFGITTVSGACKQSQELTNLSTCEPCALNWKGVQGNAREIAMSASQMDHPFYGKLLFSINGAN